MDLLSVDPVLLRTFRVVMARRSMARAADELGFVPSAVSQHVSRLERLVGTQLLIRTPGNPWHRPRPAVRSTRPPGHFSARWPTSSAHAYIARAKDRVTRNRMVVAAAAAAHPRLDRVPPAAGVVGFPWITGASEAQCRDLYRSMAEDRKTLVIPGSGFELPDTYFRIGFGTDPAELRTGLGQLTAALDELGSMPAVPAASGRESAGPGYCLEPILFMTNIGTTRSSVAYLIEVLVKLARELEDRVKRTGPVQPRAHDRRVSLLTKQPPPLPGFSAFHDCFRPGPGAPTPEGDLWQAFFLT